MTDSMCRDSIIPSDWGLHPFRDLFAFTKRPPGLDIGAASSVPFVPMESIPEGGVLSSFGLRDATSVTSGTYFEEGDLLLSRITPCFENGKQALVAQVPGGWGMATTEVFPIRAIDTRASLSFLDFLLRDTAIRHSLANKMEGATGRRRLRRDALEELSILLPPVPQQKAIASLLMNIQSAIEIESRRIAFLKELNAAATAKVFREGLRGEPLKHTKIGEFPESWPLRALGEFAEVGNGSTPSRRNPAYWNDGSVPWLTSTKVHEVFIRSADQFITEAALAECHLPLVPKGSLLVAITGQGKTLGNVAITTLDTCINQHLAFARWVSQEVLAEFVLFFLQTRYQDLRSIGLTGGSTKGALTCNFLKSYLIPVPSIGEQRDIASILGTLLSRIWIAERRRKVLADLFDSTLHQLMTAQLRVTPLLEQGQTKVHAHA